MGIPSLSTGTSNSAIKAAWSAAFVMDVSICPDLVRTAALYVVTSDGVVAVLSSDFRVMYQSVGAITLRLVA